MSGGSEPAEGGNMKAIRVNEPGGPEVMKLEDVPDPEAGAGQVLAKVHAAGVNPVDAYVRSGRYGRLELPYTPGSDAAGVVEAVGRDVTTVGAGDRVYLWGTISGAYAEKTLCEAGQAHPLPDRISFAQGAAIGIPYATAYRALFQRARAVAGDVVLVHGASGGVGIAAVQLARAAGMTVIGTAGSEKGLRLVGEQGAHHVVDHHSPDHFKQALSLTDGRGVDVVLEMLANENLAGDLTILAPQGRIAVIGSRGAVEINPGDAMGREAAILGVMSRSATERELMAIHAALHAGLEDGTLRPVVGEEIPLAEAARAHSAIMEEHAYGKKVLVP
jgi:NADPH2:quinone reductase